MEEATNTNGGGGGTVGAVANAVASVVSSITGLFAQDKQKQIEYQRWLAATFPEYKWFFDYEKRRDNSLIIIGIFAALLLVMILVLMKKPKS